MITTILITALFWGFCCGVVGVVFCEVLGNDDTPLNGWFKWVHAWYERKGWRHWIASPLGGCALCFSGQLGLWSSSIIAPWLGDAMSISIHILSACSAVLCAHAINSAYTWLKNRI